MNLDSSDSFSMMPTTPNPSSLFILKPNALPTLPDCFLISYLSVSNPSCSTLLSNEGGQRQPWRNAGRIGHLPQPCPVMVEALHVKHSVDTNASSSDCCMLKRARTHEKAVSRQYWRQQTQVHGSPGQSEEMLNL